MGKVPPALCTASGHRLKLGGSTRPAEHWQGPLMVLVGLGLALGPLRLRVGRRVGLLHRHGPAQMVPLAQKLRLCMQAEAALAQDQARVVLLGARTVAGLQHRQVCSIALAQELWRGGVNQSLHIQFTIPDSLPGFPASEGTFNTLPPESHSDPLGLSNSLALHVMEHPSCHLYQNPRCWPFQPLPHGMGFVHFLILTTVLFFASPSHCSWHLPLEVWWLDAWEPDSSAPTIKESAFKHHTS